MYKKLCTLVCLVSLVSIISPELRAATTFTGAIDNTWEQPFNWSGSAVPTGTDDAIIGVGLTAVSSGVGNVAQSVFATGSTLDVVGGDLTAPINAADGGSINLTGGAVSSVGISLGIAPAPGVWAGSVASMTISGGSLTGGGINVGIIAGSDATLTVSGSAATINITGPVDAWGVLAGGQSTLLFEIDTGGISTLTTTSYISLASADFGVSAIGGYVPVFGDSFILATATAGYDVSNLNILTPEWNIQAVGVDLVATYVPEPATVCLLGLGGLMLRRKKRQYLLGLKPNSEVLRWGDINITPSLLSQIIKTD